MIGDASVYSLTECIWRAHGLPKNVPYLLCSSLSLASELGIVFDVVANAALGTASFMSTRYFIHYSVQFEYYL